MVNKVALGEYADFLNILANSYNINAVKMPNNILRYQPPKKDTATTSATYTAPVSARVSILFFAVFTLKR